MKKHNMKRTVTAAAVLSISIIMTACGGKTESTGNTPEASSTAETSDATDAAQDESVAPETNADEEISLSKSLPSEDKQSSQGVIPAVTVMNYYDDDGNLRSGGFLVLSEGFDALSESLHQYNLGMKEYALSFKEDLAENSDYRYEGTAVITRCDAQIFSCRQEIYVYLGMSDARPVTFGNTYDVSTGQELWLGNVITDQKLFEKVVLEKLQQHPDSVVFQDGWEDEIGAALWGDAGSSWYLTDEGMEVSFGRGSINPTDQTTIRISYEECEDFLQAGCMKNSGRICHLVDDYGEYCLEYCFDADGDGQEEVLQLDSDFEVNEDNYVEGVTPIISFGRDESSLKTVYGDYAFEMKSAWVMESADGKFYLYEEALGEEDGDSLRIYDLSDPDEGPVYMGDNATGAFYSFIPTDPDHVYVENRVYMMGTYSGYTKCSIGENGQLVTEGEPEYQIINFTYGAPFEDNENYNAPGICLTLKQDLETYVYDIKDGEGDNTTLPRGTKLYPYSCGGDGSYMVFLIRDGEYTQLYYDGMDEDSWQHTINGMPEDELLDGVVYAG